MTDEQLAEIEARANAASPGPWRRDGDVIVDASEREIARDDDPRADYTIELDFAAHARTDVPALVAEVRRLRSLFTADDAARLRSLADMVDDLDKTTPSMHGRLISGPLRNLAARIRSVSGGAIGETREPHISGEGTEEA